MKEFEIVIYYHDDNVKRINVNSFTDVINTINEYRNQHDYNIALYAVFQRNNHIGNVGPL